jgi:hypothetical protein
VDCWAKRIVSPVKSLGDATGKLQTTGTRSAMGIALAYGHCLGKGFKACRLGNRAEQTLLPHLYRAFIEPVTPNF